MFNKKVLITNKKGLKKKERRKHPDYHFDEYEITRRSDFDQLHVSIIEILPGKSAYPFHYHENNSEIFYILEGQGKLKTKDSEKRVEKGDFIVMPKGEKGVHKLTNTSKTEKLKYIDYQTTNSPDVIKYPEFKKVGIVLHNESSDFYCEDSSVDYYKGE